MTPPEPVLKKRTIAEIKAGAKVCIYCHQRLHFLNRSIEHMPPKGMFKGSQRLKGMEFGVCKSCNVGTSAADAAVAFFARIDMFGNDTTDWKTQEMVKFLKSADDSAPGFAKELLGDGSERDVIRETPGGVLVSLAEIHTGPISGAFLNVFAAKLGMALYHEHRGEPLPPTGGVHGMWFLNAGLSETTAEGFLKILPGFNTLTAGRLSAEGQFAYRYNSDDKGIVAALTHIQGNIHFFTIAMAEPNVFGFPKQMPCSAFVRPGELLSHMPNRCSPIITPMPPHFLYPSLILSKQ